MIVFRYLARDLVSATAAVAAVLLLVIISGRFIRLLADAAAGYIDPGILFAVIGYRLPGFLELILPLAFFLGVLLAYGRMYIDSEMTVLHACGFSQRRLIAYTMVVAVGVALLAGWLSIWVSPAGIARSEALLGAQKLRGEFASIEAGKFYPYGDGRGVTYTETKDADGTMHGVFLAEAGRSSGKQPRAPIIVLAERGGTRKAQADGGNFLVLENGYRIQGIPGQPDFQITSFKEYGQRLTSPQAAIGRLKQTAVPTSELIDLSGPADIATLQWRLSVPLLVLVVTLIAVPLSHTNPRSGRYGKIFPAVFLYILYLVILNGARGAVEEGDLPAVVGLWWVHLLFFAVAAALLAWNAGWRPRLAGWSRR
ncbi:MAG: LPS export ABC transporter permease LptF [Porticoccaceae bacterium]